MQKLTALAFVLLVESALLFYFFLLSPSDTSYIYFPEKTQCFQNFNRSFVYVIGAEGSGTYFFTNMSKRHIIVN
jgi:hypothetical protein